MPLDKWREERGRKEREIMSSREKTTNKVVRELEDRRKDALQEGVGQGGNL